MYSTLRFDNNTIYNYKLNIGKNEVKLYIIDFFSFYFGFKNNL